MKFVHLAAATALLTNTILVSPAFAAVTILDPTPAAEPAELTAQNLATAQAQCDAVAASMDTDGSGAESDRYTAEVVQGLPTYVSGPTEVGTESNRTIEESTRVGAGTFTPAHLTILGDPYRVGGSVNMFGIQQSVGGHYSNSAYDFTANFKTVYNIAYTCTITKEEWIEEQKIVHPAQGMYVVSPDAHGNEEGVQQSCVAFSAMQPADPLVGQLTPPWWGQPQGQCVFQGQAGYTETIPAHFGEEEVVATGLAGGNFNQEQIDELSAHESMGSGFDTSETLLIGQVVVCISPSTTTKKGAPGAWTAKNGYAGTKCNTNYYNSAPVGPQNNLNTGSNNWVTVPLS